MPESTSHHREKPPRAEKPPHAEKPPWQEDGPPVPIVWQGPELALAQLEFFLYQIKRAIDPPRPDIIELAADNGLEVVALLEQWLSSLPPGAIPATMHKPGEPAIPPVQPRPEGGEKRQ